MKSLRKDNQKRKENKIQFAKVIYYLIIESRKRCLIQAKTANSQSKPLLKYLEGLFKTAEG